MESSTTPSHDDETVLLLYLADELSAVQKQEIEHRLASDPSFSAAMNRLREVDAWLIDSFETLDRSQPLPGTLASWQRRVGRIIRQWQLREAARIGPLPIANRRVGGWAYAAATAAMVVIGYTAFWGFQTDWTTHSGKPSNVAQTDLPLPPQYATAPDPILDYDPKGIVAVEHEMSQLVDLRTSFQ